MLMLMLGLGQTNSLCHFSKLVSERQWTLDTGHWTWLDKHGHKLTNKQRKKSLLHVLFLGTGVATRLIKLNKHDCDACWKTMKNSFVYFSNSFLT